MVIEETTNPSWNEEASEEIEEKIEKIVNNPTFSYGNFFT
jgi:Ca2+-dependent lipid-binding protein